MTEIEITPQPHIICTNVHYRYGNWTKEEGLVILGFTKGNYRLENQGKGMRMFTRKSQINKGRNGITHHGTRVHTAYLHYQNTRKIDFAVVDILGAYLGT